MAQGGAKCETQGSLCFWRAVDANNHPARRMPTRGGVEKLDDRNGAEGPRRPVCGVPYLLQPMAGRRSAPRQTPDHRGTAELRSFFTMRFSAGGGINFQQAGIGVYERGPDGLLAAARVYDDIEAPVEHL